MVHTKNRPLALQLAAVWLVRQYKNSKLPLLSSLLFGLLAYTFAFTNKLVNHDEVQSLFTKGSTVSSGRWGLGGLDSIFPNISMPWIYGILAIFFIAIATCILIRIFRVENKVLQVLLGGCIMVFPSFIGTLGYMFTSSSFALSFLTAVLSVWLLCRSSEYSFLQALICMVFSLSIYQSYIAVSAGLLVLQLVWQLIHENDVASVIRCGIRYVVFLILSLGLYYGATQLILQLMHIEFNDYAAGNMGFSLASIPANILESYRTFFLYLTEGFRGIFPTALSRLLHWLFFLASLVLLLPWTMAQKKKEAGRFFLLAVLICLLPLAVNCMYLFTVPDSIHTLVLYGFIGLYVLAVIIADACIPMFSQVRWQNLLRQGLLNVMTVCLALIVVIHIYIANAAYLNLHLRYENAYSFYTALSADIRMMPEFDEDTKIAIVGIYQDPTFYEEKFPFLEELTGVKGFLPDSYSKAKFLEYYIGLSIPSASEADIAEIQETDTFAKMPCYPYYGSMQFFENILVIKLS